MLEKLSVEEVESWKPAGGVTVIGAVMLAPEMVKLLVGDAVP